MYIIHANIEFSWAYEKLSRPCFEIAKFIYGLDILYKKKKIMFWIIKISFFIKSDWRLFNTPDNLLAS